MKTHLLSTITVLSLATASTLSAASRIWDGGDNFNTNWSDADNWNGNVGITAGDDLAFPAAPLDKTMVNDLAPGSALASLVFNGGGYTVSGNPFTVGTAGITVSVAGPGVTVLEPSVSLANRQTWEVATTDDRLTMNGLVSSPGSTLTAAGSGVVNFGAGYTGHGGALLVEMDAGTSGGVRFMPGSGSSYTGATTVRAGVLETGGVSTSSIVTVESGGTLGGKGSVFRVHNAGGTIQPGRAAGGLTDAAGLITINSGLTSDAAGTFAFTVAGSTPGTGHDQLQVTGTVDPGNAVLTVALGAGYVPQKGIEYVIVDNDGTDAVLGIFDQLPEGAGVTSGGRGFYISYRGGDGNDISLRAARTWTGAAGNGLWSHPGNWDGGLAGTAPATGDSLFFPKLIGGFDAYDACQNDLPVDTHFHHIACAGYLLGLPGHRIRLAAGLTVTGGVFGPEFDIIATAPQTFAGYDTNIFLSGAINNGGFALTFLAAHSNPATLWDAVAISGIISGSGSFIKRGNSRVGVVAFQTYSGGTLVAEGTLQVSGTGSLGAASSTCVVEAGARLDFNTNNVDVQSATIAQPLVLRGTIRGWDGTTGPMIFSGPITVEGTQASVIAEVPVTLSGALSGAGSLTKTGAAPLRLSGGAANTFTGGFTVMEGGVALAKTPGFKALPGPVSLGFGSSAAMIEQLNSEQFAAAAKVAIGPNGTLDLNALDCGIATLELTGGTVMGAPGKLRLATGLTTHAAAQSALISAPLFSTPANAVWLVEDGAAVPDLKVVASVETTVASPTVQKTGAGSLQFTGAQQLQRLTVSQGDVAWDASGPTRLDCNGGTITGAGTCGLLAGMAGGGAISPGGSAAAIFHSSSLGLHATTVCRFDLYTPAPGTGFDQLISAGQPVLNNATLQLIVRPGFLAAPGTPMMLVENATGFSVSGTFAGLPEGKHFNASGRIFRISYQGGSGNDITLTAADGKATITAFTAAPGAGSAGDQTAVSLSASGAFGLEYLLESTSDLTLWTPAAQQSAGAGGTLNFSLLEPATAPRRFFRIRTL